MKPALLPALVALALVLDLAACVPEIAVPTVPGYPPTAPNAGTAYPYPPPVFTAPPTRAITPGIRILTTPNLSAVPPASGATATPAPPAVGTDAQMREAALRLEPFFQLAPFIAEADDVYREYMGCAENADVGGIVSFTANRDAESIIAAFAPFLEALGVETQGWQELQLSGSEGRAFTLSTGMGGEVALSRMSVRATIQQHPPASGTDAIRSDIWIELTWVENPVNDGEDQNKIATLVSGCPGGLSWLAIRPNIEAP